jgi:hypothetical protein
MTAPIPFVRRLLVLSPAFAVAAFVFTALALRRTARYDGWPHGPIKLMFDTAAHVLFQSPPGADTLESLTFSLARVFVVLFGLTTSLAAVLSLSRIASDAWLRLSFWFARTFLKKRPSVVVGLGPVLVPLVRELRNKGPVYAVERRAEGPGVDDARELGVLVITGDATDPKTRARVDWLNAAEIFIGTGDDLQNLQIAAGFAADAATRLRARPREDVVRAYVHTTEPARSATMEGYGLLRDRVEGFDVVPFSTSDLAARDLFFETNHGLAVAGETVPRSDEVFHLFVFGFGATGQAVAETACRFAHFSSRLRPRMTIYVDAGADGEHARQRFIECHPAFAPSGLDLSSTAFLSAGDRWDARPGRPSAKEFLREPYEDITDDGRNRRVRPVEYAVNAEFRVLPGELEASRLIAELSTRLRPAAGPAVRAAGILCFEESERNFRGALQLRETLARHFLSDPADQDAADNQIPILPVHVYIPEDRSLANLLEERPRPGTPDVHVQRAFPFRVFGLPEVMTSYAAITRGPFLEPALGIKGAYDILSGREASPHPDFDDSNLDAALHAELVKFPAMGLVLLGTPALDQASDSARGLHPTPLLASLFRRDVVEQADRFVASGRITESGRLAVSPEALEALPPLVRRRLAILGRIYEPPPAIADTEQARAHRSTLQHLIRESVTETVGELHRELCAHGRRLDLFAEMEHNRWMGERFAKGWSFGATSNVRRRRPSFVPWEDLSESDRHIDRAQLARLIVGHGATGKYAYVKIQRSR